MTVHKKSRHGLPLEERFAKFFVRGEPDACWVWEGARNDKGYGHIRVGKRVLGAHKIAYQIANGEYPVGVEVLHSCDNSSCVNPAHLSLGTTKQNQHDAWARDLKRNVRKLNSSDVEAIRASGLKQKLLAKIFGVGQSEICRVKNGTRGDSILLAKSVGG